MNPFRGVPFEKLHCRRDRHRRRQADKDVDMIGYSTGCESFYSLLARTPAKVRPQALSNLRAQHRFALFRREDTMMEGTDKRMHSFVSVETLPFSVRLSQ